MPFKAEIEYRRTLSFASSNPRAPDLAAKGHLSQLQVILRLVPDREQQGADGYRHQCVAAMPIQVRRVTRG